VKKLTNRQKIFCDNYLITGNIFQSAINAGYSEKYSKTNIYKLLDNKSVKDYLNKNNKNFLDKVKENINNIKFLDDKEINTIKSNLLGVLNIEKNIKITNKYIYNKKTNKKDLKIITEVITDNTINKLKSIELLLQIQNNLISLDNHLNNKQLKNKILENKLANTIEEIQEGYLDNITGIEIVEEHPDE